MGADLGAARGLWVLRVTRSIARGLHYAALSALGVATVSLIAAMRIADRGWNPWGTVGTSLLLAASLLVPSSLLLSAAGLGALRPRQIVLSGLLCATGAAIGLAAVFSSELAAPHRLHLRAAAAGLTALHAWGILAGVRLWRRPA